MNMKIAASLIALTLIPACAMTPSLETVSFQSSADVAVAEVAFIPFGSPGE